MRESCAIAINNVQVVGVLLVVWVVEIHTPPSCGENKYYATDGLPVRADPVLMRGEITSAVSWVSYLGEVLRQACRIDREIIDKRTNLKKLAPRDHAQCRNIEM